MDTEFCDDLLQSYSDAELIQHIVSSTPADSSLMSRVSSLSPKYISKSYFNPSEAEDSIKATELAHSLWIPCPSIRRIVTSNRNVYSIMDRIAGSTLEDIWTSLGWFLTIKLALQLRRIINTLRSLTSPTIGSLATSQCTSFWLDDLYGLPPRSGPPELSRYLHFWGNFRGMRTAIETGKRGEILTGTAYIPSAMGPFVLTHHDLAPRNLLLSPTGELWLLDWDLAGFYPIYFEYASMYKFIMPHTWGLFARWRWYLFTWIAAGSYRRDYEVLASMQSRFTRFRAGRRFELLNVGGPTRRRVS